MAVENVVSSIASQISGAIQKAARSTGISFQYLLTTAQIESGLNPQAQAPTSSAKGLYQFIDQTWLGTLKNDGASLGLGQYASAITQTADGRYEVADPSARAAIMKLRNDPSTSAMMAGALARNNASQLSGSIGRAPSEGELYAAHFLGPDGASRLINAATSGPSANAAAMFPAAAGANRGIFYNRDGSARSVGDVYSRLTGKFDNTRVAFAAPLSPAAQAAAALADDRPALRPTLTPDTAGVTQAFTDAHDNKPALPDTRPLFQAMFTDRAQAVTRTVANLWTPAEQSVAGAASVATPNSGQVNPLNLFTDGKTDARAIFSGKV
ncbi:MAG TPA: transglycosylase SLT domain-containing protein [Pseudolabrys sp.]|nr:transglycosylase SLT domain-containing protein [Pseudolabrys sp.]